MIFKTIAICGVISGCVASGQLSEHDNIRCVALCQNFPLLNEHGKVKYYIDFNSRIFYSGKMVMVELEYAFDSLHNEKLIKSETRFRYLVYKKGDQVGNLYDEGKQVVTKSISVDSTLKMEWFYDLHIYDMFKQNNITLIHAVSDGRVGTLKEQYTIVSKTDTAQKGSCYLYYSNRLKNFDYSLSRELDSMKAMKLDSIRIVNDAHIYRKENVMIDRIDQWYKMEEDSSFDKIKIKGYFDKYGK